MQSLVKLSRFLQSQNNHQLSIIRDQYLPISCDNIFNHFHDEITNIQQLNQLVPIQATIAEIMNSGKKNDPQEPPPKRIKLDLEDAAEDIFDLLPAEMINEVLDYLQFRDTIALERINRNMFIRCRDAGVKHTQSGDLDALLAGVLKDKRQIYKFARYQRIEEIVLNYFIIEKEHFEVALSALIGGNSRLKTIGINNTNLRGNQFGDVFEALALMVFGMPALEELFVYTLNDFDMRWLYCFNQIKALFVNCNDFTMAPLPPNLEAVKINIYDNTNAPTISFSGLDKLHSLHVSGCSFLESLSPTLCAKLTEICIQDIQEFAAISPKKPKFDQLQRVLIAGMDELNEGNFPQVFTESAPQLESVTVKCQCPDGIDGAVAVARNIIKGKKKMQFAISVGFGILASKHYASILGIMECFDGELDEYMIVLQGSSRFNFEDTALPDFDRDVRQKYGGADYGYYRDDTIKPTRIPEPPQYQSQAFIFRKKMMNATPDHFEHQCNVCDCRPVFY